ncbi:putative phage-like protein YoqJ [Alkalibacillus filiformis]|uniref:Phage-like protein YoqJ n=1 Tax=Alkalibacillus filiformis TaxID=200990 RepID=A0ABU0DQX0_9BACI|nr:SLOG family protein [Alkalibacillus filiformis]MDQ0350819.1 putative phage-like protein YoqJ [Alkalibacillus filiformis]
MEKKSLTITGYKPHELNIFNEQDTKITVIKEAIKRRLVPHLEEGLEWVVISGQPGVEIWAFDVIQSLKSLYHVKIAVIPPFVNQDKVWNEEKQRKYQQMISQADFSKPLSEKEYESPKQYQTRDRWLIEKTDGCMILFEEEYGGSPKFFYRLVTQYEEQHDYEIIVINSFELEEVARELQESGQLE